MFGRTVLLLLYGTHKIYDRAKRMRIAFDPEAGEVVEYVEPASITDTPTDRVARPYHSVRIEAGRLFLEWTDAELKSFGLPSEVVIRLRRLNTDHELLSLETDLAASHFDTALNLLVWGDPDGEPTEPVAIDAEREAFAPEVTAEDLFLQEKLADAFASRWFRSTEPEFLADILRHPIEDWMVFLHPDQQEMVERDHDGPARVLGPAGTGKTVVGLHRARKLAQRRCASGQAGQAPVLFTTFVNSLPPVLEGLYLRMPDTRPGGVEFTSVGQLASRLCEEAGHTVKVPEQETWKLLSTIYKNSAGTRPRPHAGLAPLLLGDRRRGAGPDSGWAEAAAGPSERPGPRHRPLQRAAHPG